MVMWDEIAAEVAKDFPDVKCDKMLVDAMTCRSKCAGGADTVGGFSNQPGMYEMALRRPFSFMPDRPGSLPQHRLPFLVVTLLIVSLVVLQPQSLDTIVATNLVCHFSNVACPINTHTLPARRHPLRPRCSPRRLNRHSTNLQSRPHTPKPQYVRTHPRLRLRHHRKGHRQPRRHILDSSGNATLVGRRNRGR